MLEMLSFIANELIAEAKLKMSNKKIEKLLIVLRAIDRIIVRYLECQSNKNIKDVKVT